MFDLNAVDNPNWVGSGENIFTFAFPVATCDSPSFFIKIFNGTELDFLNSDGGFEVTKSAERPTVPPIKVAVESTCSC